MGKCVVCKGPAVVRIDYANASFCAQHFFEFYERRIRKVLDRVDLSGKCILVALSGGKDSVSLLYALHKLKDDYKYVLKALHIRLGIGDYSDKSFSISKSLAEKLGVPLIVFDVNKSFNWTIPDAVKVLKRPACSICGLVKRWIMNKISVKEGCDYIATGHNLDDFNALGLKAFLTGRIEDIYRMPGPVLEGRREENLVGRLRPQFYLTEFENTLYAELNGLNYVDVECPLASNSTQHKYKAIWETINNLNPVAKINFLKSLEKLRKEFKESVKLNKCKICGQPTTAGREICYFCSTRRKIEAKLSVVK